MVHHQVTAFFRLHKSSTVSMIKIHMLFLFCRKLKTEAFTVKRAESKLQAMVSSGKSFNKTPTGEFKATVSDLNMSHYQAACLVISNKMGDGADAPQSAAASVWF